MTPTGLLDRLVGGLVGRAETVRRPVHLAASTAAALYLPTAPPGLGSSGVIIGKELYSGKGYIWCPFCLYGDQLPGPNWLVMGETGNGKSALVKSYCLRQIRFGRHVAVLDSKPQNDDRAEGEWAPLARALGLTPIRLEPGVGSGTAGVRINPLDPAITRTRQLSLLRTIVEVTTGRPLSERAGYALKTARTHAVTLAAATGGQATLPDLVRALLHPDPTVVADIYPHDPPDTGLRHLVEDGRDVALALDRLCEGELAGMLDAPTSLDVDLTAPIIVFDLSGMDPNTVAMPVLMAVIGVWLEHVWLRPDGRKRILVVEESWHIINNPFMARLFQRLWKFARGLGLSNVGIVHHLSDVDDTREAAALVKMASTRTIYMQKTDEAEVTARRLGLPRWAADTIPRLHRGCGVWDVNGNVQIVQHLLTATETDLCFTDQAMTEIPRGFPPTAVR